jgi:hypothetical protein
MNVKIFREIFLWPGLLFWSIVFRLSWRLAFDWQPIPGLAEIAIHLREFPAVAGRWYFFSAPLPVELRQLGMNDRGDEEHG